MRYARGLFCAGLLWAGVLGAVCGTRALAQRPAYRIKTIAPPAAAPGDKSGKPAREPVVVNMHNFVPAGSFVYYAGNHGSYGMELYRVEAKLDGVSTLIKDINPGFADSSPESLCLVNTTLLFRANDGIHGSELWKSDGTPGGTVLVRDIWPGASGSSIQGAIALNGVAYFLANDGVNGAELWRSDGTAAGTWMVKNIHPTSSSNPLYFKAFNGEIYFTADDAVHGQELWKTDGTPGGTVLVKDIEPGPTGAVYEKAVMGGALYFDARDSSWHFWRSDGTAAGTVRLDSATGNFYNGWFTPLGSLLLFAGWNTDGALGRELYKTDGTPAGTMLVKDITPGSSGLGPAGLAAAFGNCFFSDDDGSNGQELWKSNGTAAGTVRVTDIYPGPVGSFPDKMMGFKHGMFYTAMDGVHGRELWVTTEGGETYMVTDLVPGSPDSNPGNLTDCGDVMVFTADYGDGYQQYLCVLWEIPGVPVELSKFAAE